VIAVERVSPSQFQACARPPGSLDCRPTLDSADDASRWSAWSYRPGPATRLLRCDGRTLVTTLSDHRGEQSRWAEPLAALAWLGEQCGAPVVEGGPPFKGGWIGYLSYDLGRLFEKLPSVAKDDPRLPLFAFTYHDHVVARGPEGAWSARIGAGDGQAMRVVPEYGRTPGPPVSDFTRDQYEAAVRRAIEYIGAGDVFQVNLSQRFCAGLPGAPRQVYEGLRQRFPAWFGAYLDFGDHALIGNSPELFLRVTPRGGDGPRQILTRPIKGTRRRGPGLDDELRRSAKDAAELNMIVDLERNDLGRICRIGSVRVTEPRVIEAHPTVYHGAATIEGELRAEVGFVEILRATFPGGSVTGAPKIRAMEIIEELEPARRGPYCGAIGYISADGHVQFNVAIRTMIALGDRVYFSVGGGIVADSEPAAEYEETIVKARAMLAALG
jgi:para-aminobenzoate synthetase component 1